MAKHLIVVIPTIGRPELLQRTLASLEACRRPNIFHGTIVVENGRKNGAEEVVRTFRASLKARYFYIPQACQSLAKNKALEMADGDLIFFTDDDVRFHPDTLCAYAEAAAKTTGGEFYGGPLGVDYEAEPDEWLKVYLPPSAKGWCLEGSRQSYYKPDFLGANWAAFLNDLRDAGGFDLTFGFGGTARGTGEETNMQDRLLKSGIKGIYVPDAMVWHYVPAERCSPQWAIKRAYQGGIETGLNHTTPGHPVFGLSPDMLWECLKRGGKILRKMFRRDMHTRFDASIKFSFYCGFIRGCRIAHTLHGDTRRNKIATKLN